MSDALKLALRISAIDLFSGVLRHFRDEVAGTGAAAKAMQRDYDSLVRNASAGLKSLAVGGYMVEKLKPAVEQAADLQESLLSVEGILQGAHPNAAKLAAEMDRVRANSVEVARHMKYSATAVTDVTRELIQGGVPLEAILEKLDSRGNVARHGAAFMTEVLAETKHMDPAEAAIDIANLGHSFQLRPDQYGDAADIIARASVTSSGSLQQLFHNLDQVGSRAHMYGNMDLKSTAIALKALAPLGEEAGSDLGEFLSRITGGSYRGRKWMKESGFDFYDKKGQFIGLDASIREIQQRTEKMTPQKRNQMLGLLFGHTGGKAVTQLIAPSMPGVKSYWEIEQSYGEQAGLAQQQATWEKGAKASYAEMVSTIETTEATIFNPLLTQLTAVEKSTNEWAGALGDLATKHPAFAKGVSYASEAAVGAAGLYGIFRLIKAASAGSSLLKNFLAGTGSVATGVAEGKAIEKLTGVAPVFVTNWPSNLGAGLPSIAKVPEGTGGAHAEAEVVGAKGASAAAESIAANASKGATAAEAAAANAMKDAHAAEGEAAKAVSAVEHAASSGAEGASVAGWATKGAGLLKGMRWLGALDAMAWAPMPDPDDSAKAQMARMAKAPSFWGSLFHRHSAQATPVTSSPDLWEKVNGAYVGGAAIARAAQAKPVHPPITVVAEAQEGRSTPAPESRVQSADFWKMVNGAYAAGAAAKAQPPVKLDGTLTIRIDQDGRARVTKAKTSQPGLNLDVGTMLGVP